MEFLPENSILKYKPDTLQYLRNQYGFDSLKRVNDAIEALVEWAARQEHFEKKCFDKGFLERLLIYNKGSVEKCKTKIDKMCTQRTLMPEFFSIEQINKELLFASFSDALFSQLTPDHGRVHLVQFQGEKIAETDVNAYFKYFAILVQYVQFKDYCNHLTLIFDWKNGSVLDFMKNIDLSQFPKFCEVAFTGISMRIKELHMVNPSKTVETFLSVLRPLLGPKLKDRLHVHKSMDAVFEYVPKDIFPQDYGGKDKLLSQIREDLYNEIYSPEFTEYRRDMNKARTNEVLRQKDKFNEEYMGMAGTFRTLTVD